MHHGWGELKRAVLSSISLLRCSDCCNAYLWVHGRLTDHLKRAGCLYDRTTRDTWQFDVSFSANKNLTIIQDVANPSYWPAIEVSGFVVLQRIGSNSPGPSVVVNVFVNDPRINVSVNWDAGEQTLAIMVPSGIPWSEGYVRPWYVAFSLI